MTKAAALLAVLLVLNASPALARPRGAQVEARKALQAGNIRSIRDIERIVIPRMPGAQYLGFDYDPDAHAYRLKFIRDGHVIFVDVDARTGDLIREVR